MKPHLPITYWSFIQNFKTIEQLKRMLWTNEISWDLSWTHLPKCHIYAQVNWVSIGSDNGLSPGRRQAIIWTNAGMLSIGPLWTNFSEIWIEIYNFSFMQTHLIISSGKWRPFCPGENESTHWGRDIMAAVSQTNENDIIPLKISLTFVPKGLINNIPTLVQVMAWRRPGDKPLSEPMMINLLTHMCVTQPQWVKMSFGWIFHIARQPWLLMSLGHE